MKPILKNALLPAVVLAVGCAEFPNADSIDDDIRNTVNDDGVTGIATAWNGAEAPDLSLPDADVESFGREYTSVSVRYDIDRESAQALAFVERTASGELVVAYPNGEVLRKGIEDDQASRFIALEQADSGAWSVEGISIYQGTSADGSTVIEEVTVSWGNNEVVFDDIATQWNTGTLTFLPGEQVTIRVQVNDPAVIGVVHQLSDGVGVIEQKLLEPGDSDREFVNTYVAPSEAGRYFTYVDVFDEAAIIEADAPYSAAAWGMPYFVTD